MSTEKKTPNEWMAVTGIEIMDPDGWDRRNFDADWEIPLTRDEFLGKAFMSTCPRWPHPLQDEEQIAWEWPHMLPEDRVPLEEKNNVVPLLTAVKDLLETPEIAGLLEAAKAMRSIYEALVEAGFTEMQALTLTSQMAAGNVQR